MSTTGIFCTRKAKKYVLLPFSCTQLCWTQRWPWWWIRAVFQLLSCGPGMFSPIPLRLDSSCFLPPTPSSKSSSENTAGCPDRGWSLTVFVSVPYFSKPLMTWVIVNCISTIQISECCSRLRPHYCLDQTLKGVWFAPYQCGQLSCKVTTRNGQLRCKKKEPEMSN